MMNALALLLRRFLAPLILGLLATATVPLAQAGSVPDSQSGSLSRRPMVQIKIEGPLEVGMLAYLERALDEARATEAGLLVELNSPGGQVDLMWRLATALADASSEGIMTVAWVNDQALSAGALLAISCEHLYMRSRSTIGSALLVRIGPGGLMPVSEDPDVREKLTSNLRNEFAVMAEANGRPAVLAKAMVDPKIRVYRVRTENGIELFSGDQWDAALERGDNVQQEERLLAEGELFNCTGTEAVTLGLANGLAESLEEVLEKVSGAQPTLMERLPSEAMAGLLYEIWPILLFLGLVLAYIEIKVPGFGVPGVLSIVCFGVLLFGRYLVGLADIPHFVLVTAGVLLIAVEIFVVPGTVWVGMLGGLLALGGLTWSLVGGVQVFDSTFGRSLVLDDALRVAASAAVAGGAAWGLSRLLPKTRLYRRFIPDPDEDATATAMPQAHGAHAQHARVGAHGRTLTPLMPAGKVVLDGAPKLQYRARSQGVEIASNTEIRVLEVQRSGRLLVVPVEANTPGSLDDSPGQETA